MCARHRPLSPTLVATSTATLVAGDGIGALAARMSGLQMRVLDVGDERVEALVAIDKIAFTALSNVIRDTDDDDVASTFVFTDATIARVEEAIAASTDAALVGVRQRAARLAADNRRVFARPFVDALAALTPSASRTEALLAAVLGATAVPYAEAYVVYWLSSTSWVGSPATSWTRVLDEAVRRRRFVLAASALERVDSADARRRAYEVARAGSWHKFTTYMRTAGYYEKLYKQ
jgi:hypothetical protein